ncbi:unnamed protein product [Ilex paraguariensis]|uniref:Mitochondrial import inner membrane translocase subunit n=1 Tax=Ilex paraguariensis TaxID=185542 RepID=A0ABC8UTW8_9AQUA
MLGDLDYLPEEDKIRMSSMIDQLQICDSLRMYSSLVERCFTDCVDTFRRKSLDKQEETCVRRCAEKFLKHSMRVGMRFAELNQDQIPSLAQIPLSDPLCLPSAIQLQPPQSSPTRKASLTKRNTPAVLSPFLR